MCVKRNLKVCVTRHKKTHTGVKEFNCSYCDMSFSRKELSKKHMLFCSRKLNSEKNDPSSTANDFQHTFKCHHCNKVFSKNINLK